MKNPRVSLIHATCVAGLLLGASAASFGQNLRVNAFDDAGSVSGMWGWWGGIPKEFVFDPGVDAGGSTSSGSVKFTITYDNANADNQYAIGLSLAGGSQYNSAVVETAAKYKALAFDLRWDPASTITVEQFNANPGDAGMSVGLATASWGQTWLRPSPDISTEPGWQRIEIPIPTNAPDFPGIVFKKWSPSNGTGLKGTASFWIDNITLVANQPTIVIHSFDGGDIEGWSPAWGTFPDLLPGDLDATGGALPGSLRVEATYFDPAAVGWQQAVVQYRFPEPVNPATLYTHINVSVKVDPASTLSGNNDYGLFEIKNPEGGGAIGGVTLTSTEWTHVSFPLPPTLTSLNGLIFQLGSGAFLGPVLYNIDNLTWSGRIAPPPPPTLKLERAEAGLSLVHAGGGQYDRHNIYTTEAFSEGFMESTEPVSYSFTLSSFPRAEDKPGFQTHLFLVPGFPGAGASPDWNEPNVIFLDVRAAAGGAGSATLRWKVAQPSGNSQLYQAGRPSVASSTVLGSWTLTAQANPATGGATLTVAAPDGATVATELDSATAAAFSGPLRMYLGVQGNSTANIGQRVRVSSVQIRTASRTLLRDNFAGEALDETRWLVNGPAGGVQFLSAANAGFLISWGLPDDGFNLQWATSLSANAAWTDATGVIVEPGPLGRQANLSPAVLPFGNQVYFRLRKLP